MWESVTELVVVVESVSGSPGLLRELEVGELSEEVTPEAVVCLDKNWYGVDVDGAWLLVLHGGGNGDLEVGELVG